MGYFFVGGGQRSGTTLLQTILCQDPSVNPLIQEAKYLRHLVQAYKFGKMHYETETRDYFRDAAAYEQYNARIVRDFLKNTRTLFPKARHLVLREPHLTMLFPELGALLPRAKFLCVVRDPRDVIASMIRVGEKLDAQGAKGDSMARLFTSHDMAALSRHYLSFYAPALGARQPGFRARLLVLRYEDLVREPAQEVEKLRAFTGIRLADFDPDKDPDTGRVDHGKGSQYQRAWKTEHDGRKITDATIGTFADTLKPEEIAAVQEHCKGFMSKLRYVAR